MVSQHKACYWRPLLIVRKISFREATNLRRNAEFPKVPNLNSTSEPVWVPSLGHARSRCPPGSWATCASGSLPLVGSGWHGGDEWGASAGTARLAEHPASRCWSPSSCALHPPGPSRSAWDHAPRRALGGRGSSARGPPCPHFWAEHLPFLPVPSLPSSHQAGNLQETLGPEALWGGVVAARARSHSTDLTLIARLSLPALRASQQHIYSHSHSLSLLSEHGWSVHLLPQISPEFKKIYTSGKVHSLFSSSGAKLGIN